MKAFDDLQILMHARHPHPGLSVMVPDRVMYEYFSNAPVGEWLHDPMRSYTFMKLDDWFEHIRRYSPELEGQGEVWDREWPSIQLTGLMTNGMEFQFLYDWQRKEGDKTIILAHIGIVDFHKKARDGTLTITATP